MWLQDQRKAIRRQQSTRPLLDFVPAVTPSYSRPDWLTPYADVLECALGSSARVVVAAPPQHGKTVLTLHGYARWLRQHPHLHFVYATYSQDRADRVAFDAESVFRRAGLKWHAKKGYWKFPQGGSILWTSLTGPITGQPVNGAFVIDDPIKDRKQANSAVYRQDTIDRLDDIAETRVHPGVPIIVMATRWHPQDLSGQLIKRGWKYVNIKALADGVDQPEGDNRRPGEALCEERKPLAELQRLRKVNPFSFASLFQGQPRPRGATIFQEPTYYTELPTDGFRVGYGLDLAYSERTSSDWSVLIRLFQLKRMPVNGVPQKPLYYVVGAWHRQVKAPEFASLVKNRQVEYRATAYFYCAGPEKGAADLMGERDVNITTMHADVDKFTRAQDCAEAWNEGRILWPAPRADEAEDETSWAVVGLDQITNFTGVKDPNDDFVDALVSGFDGMERYAEEYDESFDRYLPSLRV